MSPSPSFAVISVSAWHISMAWARDSSAQGPAIRASGRSLAKVMLPMLTRCGAAFIPALYSRGRELDQPRLPDRRLDEGLEQRMGLEGLRLQLRMELDANEPRMLGQLDDLGQDSIGGHAREAEAGRFQPFLVVDVDLIAVPVALADPVAAVDGTDLAVGLEPAVIGAEPHAAAEITTFVAPLDQVAAHPFGHQADDRLVGRTELGRVRLADAGEVSRPFDHGHLHPEADAEIGNPAFSREAGRMDLAFRPALSEPARHQDAMHAFQVVHGVFAFEDLGIDPVEAHLDVVGDAAMDERLAQGFVGIQ